MIDTLIQLNVSEEQLDHWDNVIPYLEQHGYSLEFNSATDFAMIELRYKNELALTMDVDLSRGLNLKIVTDLLTKFGFEFKVKIKGEQLKNLKDVSAIRLRRGEESYFIGTNNSYTTEGEGFTHLSKPQLSWLFPSNHRLKSLVHVFDDRVNGAASELNVNEDLIRQALQKHSSHEGAPRFHDCLAIYHEALVMHFAEMRDLIEMDEYATAAIEVNTSAGNFSGIVRENKDFVNIMMFTLLKKVGFHNFSRLDWNSIVEVLMDLGDGVNGAYLNDLSRFDESSLYIVETEDKVALVIASEYGDKRRKKALQHNQYVKQLSLLEQELRPFSADICLNDGLFTRSQGVCPVKPNTAKHPVHVYQWIVDIAKASYEEYMLKFEA